MDASLNGDLILVDTALAQFLDRRFRASRMDTPCLRREGPARDQKYDLPAITTPKPPSRASTGWRGPRNFSRSTFREHHHEEVQDQDRTGIHNQLHRGEKLRVQEHEDPCNVKEQQQHEHHAVNGVLSGYHEDRRNQDDRGKVDKYEFVYHFLFTAFPPIKRSPTSIRQSGIERVFS